jgi:hypothetical protein
MKPSLSLSYSPVLFSAVFLLSLPHSGCVFSGGASTFQKTTSASGSGFLSATEQNGQWGGDGPPPQVGEVTERPIYRKMEKTSVLSLGYFGRVYELTDLYPSRRRRIAAIREVGTEREGNATIHYYEVEFDPEVGGSEP